MSYRNGPQNGQHTLGGREAPQLSANAILIFKLRRDRSFAGCGIPITREEVGITLTSVSVSGVPSTILKETAAEGEAD